VVKLKSRHDLINRYDMSVSQITMYMLHFSQSQSRFPCKMLNKS